ncbi:MAG TPA: hypothetical protein PLS90_10955 [Candidatus Sumerlaeota bacterium]|nr:MAG: hypothetical protein BWZ08_00882 [candidate division BRC1 bacterium ADurb.BinA292]HOE96723.1 hypothetical protein [Candidatus Sumerlaeota bacterium]HOR26399.1 hypothetical protein [Candidatus Sumerlaeota bacterium]HPK02963.1 hypothetical protein [Candidatus Sumerlaeota bacterium]
MARRKAARANPSGWGRTLGLIVACLALGAGAALFSRGGMEAARQWLREQTLARADGPPPVEIDPEMSRAALERENQRLREQLEAKDRELAELTIQLKLMEEGSRSE